MSDHDFALGVARLLERIARLSQAQARENDLNPAQWEALRYLARANRFSRGPSAAALFLAATKGTVSQTLIALERKGLVAKRPNPIDRRGAVLDVTRRGHELIEASDPAAGLAEAIGALPPLHVSIISQTLTRVVAELVTENGGRSFGHCVTCRHFQHNAAPGGIAGPHRCARFDAPLSVAEAEMICVEHEIE